MKLNPALLCLLVSASAHADWQYTKWGMTVEQVQAASKGVAVKEERKATYSEKQTNEVRLSAPYSSGIFQFVAYFRFDTTTGLLAYVDLKLVNMDHAQELFIAMGQKYGKPLTSRMDQFSKNIVWDSGGDRIILGQILSSPVEITYQPLISKNNAGL